jgi:hypothetical protein
MSGALSIQRLEGSRPRLRRTRALCKFNRGKVGRRGAAKLCGEAQKTAQRGLELAEKQNGRKRRVEKREEEISSAARRRTTNGAEARRVSELCRVISCGSRGHERRRTKLDFSSRFER